MPVVDTPKIEPPALPVAVSDYSSTESEQFRNILRLFFNRLVNSINIVINYARPTINWQYGPTYTLTLDDENAIILAESSSAFTVYIPPDVPEGYLSVIYQQGTGQVTLAPGTGVTLNDSASLLTRTQYSGLTVVHLGNNEYNVHGDML